ncbi:hypothetical protein C0Q70_15100 [Pomacea canaliculata]|uniref:PDZ domain-containing protein n=1 Tax=Pomacea canaliculata TaxID=400727 RepID=A0A2T7NTZ2_POMCA|nr:hypothetical protein C0Q70_15100 [Pomacea canaliculata]
MEFLNTSSRSLKSLPDLTRSANINSNTSSQNSVAGEHKMMGHGNGPPDLVSHPGAPSKAEELHISIVRGPMGFGFTIADSPYGQKVKQILDRPRCQTLAEGDLLHKINGIDVRNMTHAQIVQVLKDCPIGAETQIIVQRGGLPVHSKKKMKSSQSFEDRPQLENEVNQLNTPGAYFFMGSDNDAHNNSSNNNNNEPSLPDADEIDGVKPHGKIVNSEMRPKTPTFSGMESRPKTPLQNRPKTPTSQGYGMNSDARGKPSYGNRSAYDIYESRSPEENHVTKFSEGVSNERGHQENEYENSHVGTSNNIESLYERARPPTGPRMDPFRQNDIRLESRNRPEYRDGHGYGRQNEGDGYGYGYARDVKPGQFRSRTPGPEIMARGGPGPDYRTEAHRPKTPTAQDMRSKTPMPTSHTYGANDLRLVDGTHPIPTWSMGGMGDRTTTVVGLISARHQLVAGTIHLKTHL